MISRLLLSLLLIIQASTQGGPATMGGPSVRGGSGSSTPTLMLSHGTSGLDGNRSRAVGLNNIKFNLEPSGFPRAVTTGETIVMLGLWPDSLTTANGFPANCASHCLPTFTDDKSNTWNSVFSTTTPCQDAQGHDHGIYYAQNAAAGTSVINESHPVGINESHWTWAHFYNMATTSITDGSSCTTGITPVNNTSPNISGTAFTTAASGDLILICIDDEATIDLASGNTWNSVTFPSGFTGFEDVSANVNGSTPGHACAYGIQGAAGSFTPTFTVSQTTHSSFSIYAVALKAGSGGSAPGAGKSILLSEQYILGAIAATSTTNLPCPAGTTGIIIADDAGSITSVSDSAGHSFTKVQNGAGLPSIFYAVGITVSSTNTLTVSLTVSVGANVDEIGLYCTNVTAVDTVTTAANTSANIGASTGGVTNSLSEATGAGNCQGTAGTLVTCSDLPSWTPGVSGDLTITVGGIGIGPATQCTSTACVFDDPFPILLADMTGTTAALDANNYSNGDFMGHHWQNSNATITEIWKAMQNASSATNIAVTFK